MLCWQYCTNLQLWRRNSKSNASYWPQLLFHVLIFAEANDILAPKEGMRLWNIWFHAECRLRNHRSNSPQITNTDWRNSDIRRSLKSLQQSSLTSQCRGPSSELREESSPRNITTTLASSREVSPTCIAWCVAVRWRACHWSKEPVSKDATWNLKTQMSGASRWRALSGAALRRQMQLRRWHQWWGHRRWQHLHRRQHQHRLKDLSSSCFFFLHLATLASILLNG